RGPAQPGGDARAGPRPGQGRGRGAALVPPGPGQPPGLGRGAIGGGGRGSPSVREVSARRSLRPSSPYQGGVEREGSRRRILMPGLLLCVGNGPLAAQEPQTTAPPRWDARGVGPLPRMGITSLDVSDDGKEVVVGTIASFGDP